jgi:hypothetical protein
MNKKIFIYTLSALALSTATNAWSQSAYVAPTGAKSCYDCHLSTGGFKPEVVAAVNASTSYNDKIARLTAYIQTLYAPDTKPVLHPVNVKWNITVGEVPLSIPFVVSDAENDTFNIHGSVATGMTVSAITTNTVSQLPTCNLKWTPTAAQAGKNYPVSIYVKETGTGRTLASNTVATSVKVWPARANAATAKVKQFSVLSAQWKSGMLKLTGQVLFKSTVTAAQRTTALANLRLNIKSQSGKVIGSPLALSPTSTGNWTKSLSLTASQVPCMAVSDYEGLKAERGVNLAPATTCVK